MAMKKISRKELLQEKDEFITLSGKIAEYVNSHLQQLKYFGYSIAVVLVVYFIFLAWSKAINNEGQTAYNQASNDIQAWMTLSNPETESLKASGTLLSTVIDDYSMSKAARLAFPLAAYIKFQEKNYPEAITLFKDFFNEFSGDDQYASLARLSLASCYEAKGDLKTAIETLDPLVDNSSGSFREFGMWSLARLYRLDNKPKKAKEILNIFVAEYKNSPYFDMAKAQL